MPCNEYVHEILYHLSCFVINVWYGILNFVVFYLEVCIQTKTFLSSFISTWWVPNRTSNWQKSHRDRIVRVRYEYMYILFCIVFNSIALLLLSHAHFFTREPSWEITNVTALYQMDSRCDANIICTVRIERLLST